MRIEYNKRRVAYKSGVIAEYVAAMYLVFKGYRPLKLRYKTKSGEIDLIVLRGRSLVFVEVKNRKSIREAHEAVLPRGRRRIEKAAMMFLSENPQYQNYDLRFDVVGLVFRKRILPIHIEHLDNAWLLGS